MKKTVKGFVDSEGNEYQYKDEIARSQNQNLEEEINSNKTYMDKVKTELKNDNKTLNGRIDTILTGTVNTTKLVTVHSATIRNNSASDLTFKISSKDNETLKSIKDKSPTVINANVIAKALDGVAINGKGIPSSYNVESTNDEYVITVYSGSSSVVGQYVFMAVVTIAYEDIATDISSAELKDVRAGADGTVYKSAGEAVRQQIGSLKESLDNQSTSVSKIENSLFKESDYEEIEPIETLNGKAYESDGKLHVGTGYYSAKYSTQDVKKIKIRNWVGGNIPLLVFFLNDTYLSCYEPETGWTGSYLEIDIPRNANVLYAQGTDNGIYTKVTFKTIDTSYNIRKEIEKIEESLNKDDSITYETEILHDRLTRLEKENDFTYKKFDKSYVVLTIDDGNKYWGKVYDVCHSLGVPLCVATIPENLNISYDNRTIKDICNLVVADGGEVLSHSYEILTKDSIEEDYIKVFKTNKKTLVENGFNVRGIIIGGGADYITNTEKQDNYSRKYFDYSDLHGLDTSVQYHKPRLWYHDYTTIENVKKWVDITISKKEFTVLAMHGSDDTKDLEQVDNLKQILEYIISKGSDKIEITTWEKVYDTFGSTVLEERIKALEEKVSN